MNIPSAEDTIYYFRHLGHDLVSLEGKGGARDWELHAGNSQGSRKFRDLLSVWTFWMQYAYPILWNDRVFKALVKAYEHGDLARQQELASALQARYWSFPYTDHSSPSQAAVLDSFFQSNLIQTLDDLPANWKDEVAEILKECTGSLSFEYRALIKLGLKTEAPI